MREKLTVEEKVSLALELIKRARTLDEIQQHYRVSHTTAYKIRNAFLAGGRAALEGEREHRRALSLEARVDALEQLVTRAAARPAGRPRGNGRLAG
ncbi:MAG TPA: hypothetical protein VMW17_16505 [Candidatus Binatia bacterium]|nr:hypothetical protein [Candidatus Binatia bacterium]